MNNCDLKINIEPVNALDNETNVTWTYKDRPIFSADIPRCTDTNRIIEIITGALKEGYHVAKGEVIDIIQDNI